MSIPKAGLAPRLLWLIVLAACLGALHMRAEAEDAPKLTLRLHLASAALCPLDPLEATVEFINSSKDDLHIEIPGSNGSGSTWLEVFPAGRPPNNKRASWAEAATVVTLHPGESATSPTLWVRGDGYYSNFAPGNYQVRAQYHCARTYTFLLDSRPGPSLLDSTSESADLEVKWCCAAAEQGLARIGNARSLEGAGKYAEAIGLLQDVRSDAPPCLQRAAWEREYYFACHSQNPDASIEAIDQLWRLAQGVAHKESVVGLIGNLLGEFGYRVLIPRDTRGHRVCLTAAQLDRVSKIVGDYHSQICSLDRVLDDERRALKEHQEKPDREQPGKEGNTASPEDAHPLTLRLHLAQRTLCPLDPLEATVEFINSSKHVDLQIELPLFDGSGGTWLEVVPAGHDPGKPFLCQGSALRSVRLRPGQSVTSPFLWKKGRAWDPTFCPEKYRVYARYYQPRSEAEALRAGPSPALSVADAISEPVDLEVKWCSHEAMEKFAKMKGAILLKHGDAIHLLHEVRESSPRCVQRVSLETEYALQVSANDPDGCIEAVLQLWGLAQGIGEKEGVFWQLEDLLTHFGSLSDPPASDPYATLTTDQLEKISKIFGDYEPRSFRLRYNLECERDALKRRPSAPPPKK